MEPGNTDISLAALDVYSRTLNAVGANEKWMLSRSQFDLLVSSPGFDTVIITSPKGNVISFAGLLRTGDTLNALLIGNAPSFEEKYATDLLYYEIIRRAIQGMNGVKFVNFGGGRTLSSDDTLLKFKLKFSLGHRVPSKYLAVVHDSTRIKPTEYDRKRGGFDEPDIKIMKSIFPFL